MDIHAINKAIQQDEFILFEDLFIYLKNWLHRNKEGGKGERGGERSAVRCFTLKERTTRSWTRSEARSHDQAVSQVSRATWWAWTLHQRNNPDEQDIGCFPPLLSTGRTSV